jgi:prevent-host-death family protein
MTVYNVHAAKTRLSRLLEEAMAGKDVVIAKAGKPMVRLVPFKVEKKPRRPGALRGRIRIHKDFDAPLPAEISRAFGVEP